MNTTDIVENSSGGRKVWSIIQANGCSHTPMHVWVVQEHIGTWCIKNGKEEWVPTKEPYPHRLVYMRMTDDGKLENVHSPYNGPQRY